MIWFPSALNILIVSANILGVAMLAPQALKLARTGDTAGVSAQWAGLGAAINLGWLAYGTVAGLVGLIPVSAGSLAVYIWMLLLISRQSSKQLRQARDTASALLLILLVAAGIGGTVSVGVTLGVLYTFQFAPAAWEAATSVDLSGIAPATWLMALAEAVIWALYGAATGDLGLIIGGLGATTMSIVILGYVYQFRSGRLRRRHSWQRPRVAR